MSASFPAERARGCAVGAVAAGLTVAAHGLAGGGYPGGAALTLLLTMCAMVGAAATFVRFSTRLMVAALLGFGQFAGHFMLSGLVETGHTHQGSPFGGWLMVASHATATVLCALLIAGAERLYAAVSNTLQIVLRSVAPIPMTPRRSPLTSQTTPALFRAPLRGALSRRGPPLAA